MDDQLIFDIGFHKGEDTSYYLHKGYRVVAVDAAPQLVACGKACFHDAATAGRLVLLNKVIAATAQPETAFYLSQNSEWSSVHQKIAERRGMPSTKLALPAVTLSHLMKEYGVPLYCKIDIEGNDAEALDGLRGVEELPRYISVETECLDDSSDAAASRFTTLEKLHRLGYNRFKLVDQTTLSVLDASPFYGNASIDPWKDNKAYAKNVLNISHSDAKFSEFFPGSCGPFGNDLAGNWCDFPTAKNLLRSHSEDQRALGQEVWSFWCDWHATF